MKSILTFTAKIGVAIIVSPVSPELGMGGNRLLVSTVELGEGDQFLAPAVRVSVKEQIAGNMPCFQVCATS